jgi:hypothetical protein
MNTHVFFTVFGPLSINETEQDPLPYWRWSSLIPTFRYFLFQWIVHNKKGLDEWDVTWGEFEWRGSALKWNPTFFL